MLVGHAHPDVTAAVQRQVAKGSTFFVNNEANIQLAEAGVDAVACAERCAFCRQALKPRYLLCGWLAPIASAAKL